MRTDSEIIDELGGTGTLANWFGIKMPNVSEWRRSGIPESRRQTLALAYPDIAPKGWLPPGFKPNDA